MMIFLYFHEAAHFVQIATGLYLPASADSFMMHA